MSITTATAIDLAPDDARTRCDRIKKMVSVVADDIAALYEGRGWLALGYTSWAELCRVEFDGVQLAPSRRREVVTDLRDAGLSVRAIASATGTTKSTIDRDLQVSRSGTPEGDDDFLIVAEESVVTTTITEPVVITGTDGKRYPTPPTRAPVAARPSRRRPLPDAYRSAAHDLVRAVERLKRLTADDRLTANLDVIADRHCRELFIAGNELIVIAADLGAAERLTLAGEESS